MKSRRQISPLPSNDCAPVGLLLTGSPRLAALLLLHGTGLPLALLASGLRHCVWAALGCALLAALASPEVLRLCLGRGTRAPRRLVFGADGRMRLDLAGGFSCDVLPGRRS